MNFVTFNQDYSHLAVGKMLQSQKTLSHANLDVSGTSRGFRIYTTDPFSKCFETKQGDIALLEMLFSTSLVALILSPRRLQITNTKVRPRLVVLFDKQIIRGRRVAFEFTLAWLIDLVELTDHVQCRDNQRYASLRSPPPYWRYG